MARNEEKQYGRLNRLWIQKEKEEGRIKDVHSRPKLSTLNSVNAVRKWMPSIKDEIEYYLQQSQLSHYPERKIAEFKLHIEELEREYKRFLNKLRALDPSHKHHPWTPRAYAKRRLDTPDAPDDCYHDDSVKAQERFCCGVSQRYIIGVPATRKPSDFKLFLANDENKTQLCKLLLEVWVSKASASRLEKCGTAVVVVEGKSYQLESSGGNVTTCEIPQVESTQEQTDTQIVLHLLYAAQLGHKVAVKTW
ncbi:uncharacterized protein LOC143116692 isoform X3 [Alosa pseudoharengus]|uniref:uncharacterized protein LOC143116692 isoform X3 n=1 Tax=Alosa pseudoharengus TaxID=34774 RepID=UPI003F8BA62F